MTHNLNQPTLHFPQKKSHPSFRDPGTPGVGSSLRHTSGDERSSTNGASTPFKGSKPQQNQGVDGWTFLVGGFNPIEKYESKGESSPIFGVKTKSWSRKSYSTDFFPPELQQRRVCERSCERCSKRYAWMDSKWLQTRRIHIKCETSFVTLFCVFCSETKKRIENWSA